MNRNSFDVSALAAAAALLMASHAAWAHGTPTTREERRAMARADLDATHAPVLSAYPGDQGH